LTRAAGVVLLSDAQRIYRSKGRGLDPRRKRQKYSATHRRSEAAGVAASEIGHVVAGEGARFMRDGKVIEFARPSFSHF